MPTTSKKTHLNPPFELLYHPSIPGRGEFIRLVLEAAGVAYRDVANDEEGGYDMVREVCMNTADESDEGNPPVFAPPALRVPGVGRTGGALVISQTANILQYLGWRVGMAAGVTGRDQEGDDTYFVHQVTLTALDLNNEAHDTHHPLAVAKYYEDQKEAALVKSKDFRENRMPKFFSYFQRVLRHNQRPHADGAGKYLVGATLTYADTTVWQVLDGLFFAFPREMEERKKGEFAELLDGFYTSIKTDGRLTSYLESDRRMKYSMGVFRHYPELDRQ